MSLFQTLGLAPDLSGAIAGAKFDPYNIQTGMGGLRYDEGSRTFTSQLDPALQATRQGLLSQYGQIDPAQQLSLYRQQAQPYEEQQRLGLESRLFSQGQLGHSAVDRPGGARRSLFDAQAQADLQRQAMAQQWAQQQQQGILGQLQGIQGFEKGLFGMGQGMGQLGMQGQQMQTQLRQQQAMAIPDLMQSLLGGAAMGFASSYDWGT